MKRIVLCPNEHMHMVDPLDVICLSCEEWVDEITDPEALIALSEKSHDAEFRHVAADQALYYRLKHLDEAFAARYKRAMTRKTVYYA